MRMSVKFKTKTKVKRLIPTEDRGKMIYSWLNGIIEAKNVI